MTNIDFERGNLVIEAPWTTANVVLLRQLEQSAFMSKARECGAFVARPTQKNLLYLRAAFANTATWSESAELEATRLIGPRSQMELDGLEHEVDTSGIEYDFGPIQPYPHQLKAFALYRDRKSFGLLMDPRTGKTYVALHGAYDRYERSAIDRVLVICPKSIKSIWEEQLEEHTPKRFDLCYHVHRSGRGTMGMAELENFARFSPKGKLPWLIVNVEALVSQEVLHWVLQFCGMGRTDTKVDESTCIKSPAAQRTKATIRVGHASQYRTIMSGTPAPNGPFDLFSQFLFLDPQILGARSFTSYQYEYGDKFGHRWRYKNLDKLRGLIHPFSYRVRQEDAFKHMPVPSYTRVRVDMTERQAKMYDEMAENLITEIEESGQTCTATVVLTKMTRLMQITGGWVQPDRTGLEPDPRQKPPIQRVPGDNPKLQALMELLEELRLQPDTVMDLHRRPNPNKVVIWAAFSHEIVMVEQAIAEAYGEESVASFYGKTPERQRDVVRRSFQDPLSPLSYFVGQPSAGGMGLSLWRSNSTVFFSNTYDFLHRDQAESRIRIDRPDSAHVGYYDIVCRGTWDEMVLRTLKAKQDVASVITGDNIRDLVRRTK